MNKKTGITALLVFFTLAITVPAEAKTINFDNGQTYGNYRISIIEMMFNGTTGTPNALSFASADEPLSIINAGNRTITVNIIDWGIDSSRSGVLLEISNGSTKYLMPLERGWGSQIDDVSFGNINIQIGMTEIFRGRPKEFVKLCVVIRKLPN